MLPELFRIPGLNLPIYGYGVMLAIGFLLAVELGRHLARRRGLPVDFVSNLALVCLVSGIVGARIVFVLQYPGAVFDPEESLGSNVIAALNLMQGGLVYYGGFLGALTAGLLYALWKRVSIKTMLDVGAVGVMIGLGFGRIGCVLNGCCWGEVSHTPQAITFPYDSPAMNEHVKEGLIELPPQLIAGRDADGHIVPVPAAKVAEDPELRELAEDVRSLPVHPTQIYSSASAFMVAGVCLLYFFMPHAPGRVFSLMLILEGSARFIIESMRVEPTYQMNLSLSMWISGALVVAGVVLWFVFGARSVGITAEATPGPATAQA